MKIAVVGAGAIGRVHMKVVQAYASANPNPNVHAKCELSAVVDPSEAAKSSDAVSEHSLFFKLRKLAQSR
jgi:predicted dehydrogenase